MPRKKLLHAYLKNRTLTFSTRNKLQTCLKQVALWFSQYSESDGKKRWMTSSSRKKFWACVCLSLVVLLVIEDLVSKIGNFFVILPWKWWHRCISPSLSLCCCCVCVSVRSERPAAVLAACLSYWISVKFHAFLWISDQFIRNPRTFLEGEGEFDIRLRKDV
jgi:hypothetical protein